MSKKKIKRRRNKAQKLARPALELRSAKQETRSFRTKALSVRRAADGSMQLAGTAIVFDSPSQDLGGFTEIVKNQAVQRSLQRNDDVYILWQHDSSQPLARTKTGTLKLTLTSTGLDFVATLPKSPLGQNAFQAVADGTVDSVSFGFSVQPDGDKWITNELGNVVRELWDINVTEISPVTWAAYSAPSVDTRSCPVALRGKLKRDLDDDLDGSYDDEDDDDDDDDEDGDEEDRCACDCSNCEAGDCDACTDPDCGDDDCQDCPAQHTRAAHAALMIRRLR